MWWAVIVCEVRQQGAHTAVLCCLSTLCFWFLPLEINAEILIISHPCAHGWSKLLHSSLPQDSEWVWLRPLDLSDDYFPLLSLYLSPSLSLTVSLSAPALTPFLCYPLSHLLFSSLPSFPPLFLFFTHPFLPPFFHSPSLPLSFCLSLTHSLWPETDNAVGKKKKKATEPVVSKSSVFPAVHCCMCLRVSVLDTGQRSHPLSCHISWPENHEWGLVDSWPGACCRGERRWMRSGHHCIIRR